jgi:hypothetical protein
VDRVGTAGRMAGVVRCTTVRPAGIRDRLAAIASATGEMKNEGAGLSRPFLFWVFLPDGKAQQKTPLFEAGFSYFVMRKSDRAATSVAPDKSDRAGAARNHNHRPLDHDDAGLHHHGPPVGPAFAIAVTMETRAATAFGACAADACNRACNQCGCEKILHVVFLPKAAKRHLYEVDKSNRRAGICHRLQDATSLLIQCGLGSKSA